MREIKFRAWDKNRERMFVPDAIVMDSPVAILNLNDYRHGDFPKATGWRGQAHFELMQFTGLKDKNGKDVYEGDVVEFNKEGTRVDRDGYAEDYREGIRRRIVVDDIRNIRFDGESANGGHWHAVDIEVVGNLYENPTFLPPDNQRGSN